jgi:1,2-phenylacetyl-CoA epoxidase catalytic subunit
MTRDGEYRSKLLKLLADQARAELEASNTYSRWIPKAPGPEERMHLAEIAREETEHWYGTIKILEGLGVSVKEANDEWATNHWFYTIVHLLILRYQWEDIFMLTFLMDRCAFLLVEDFAQSSYAPWARFAKHVLEEEQGMWTSVTASFAHKWKSWIATRCSGRLTSGGALRLIHSVLR